MTTLILDTETHDLNGNAIEIAYYPFIIVNGNGQHDTKNGFKQRFNPGAPISIGAMATHHILDSDVAGCSPHTDFSLSDLGQPVEYLIGHNIDYDIGVIERAGVDVSNIKAICTLAMARKLWPEFEARTISYLIYALTPDKAHAREQIKNAHSAWQDILMTGFILDQILLKTGIKSIKDLYLFSEMARLPTHLTFGRYRGTAIADVPADWVRWYCNQLDTDPYLIKAFRAAGFRV